jgi:hypothetical protein
MPLDRWMCSVTKLTITLVRIRRLASEPRAIE